MRRFLPILVSIACVSAALACGKYGPPVRADQKDRPSQTEEQGEEATP